MKSADTAKRKKHAKCYLLTMMNSLQRANSNVNSWCSDESDNHLKATLTGLQLVVFICTTVVIVIKMSCTLKIQRAVLHSKYILGILTKQTEQCRNNKAGLYIHLPISMMDTYTTIMKQEIQNLVLLDVPCKSRWHSTTGSKCHTSHVPHMHHN
jgi:hypothetical protein